MSEMVMDTYSLDEEVKEHMKIIWSSGKLLEFNI